MSQEPYIQRVVRSYNPDYGDDRICGCGHTYDRHFDSYEENAPVGCKYCPCRTFKEASVDARPVVMTKKDLLQYGKIALIRNGDDLFDTPTHVAIPMEYLEEIARDLSRLRDKMSEIPDFRNYAAATDSIIRVAAEVDSAREQYGDERSDECANFHDQRGF